eukprot:515762_1
MLHLDDSKENDDKQDIAEFDAKLNNINAGIIHLHNNKTISETYDYHSNFVDITSKKWKLHYQHCKIMVDLLQYEFISFKEVHDIYKINGGDKDLNQSNLKKRFFTHKHGIPCVLMTLPSAASEHADSREIYVIHNEIDATRLNTCLYQIIMGIHQHFHKYKQIVNTHLKQNNKDARKLNDNIAVTLNKKIANKLYSDSYIKNRLGFRNITEERDTFFNDELKKLDSFIAGIDNEITECNDDIKKRESENKKLNKQLQNNPHMNTKLRRQIRIKITKNNIRLKELQSNRNRILKRKQQHVIRQQTTRVRTVLQKMNKGGAGNVKHITKTCIEFCELLLQQKTSNLDADDRRRFEVLNLNSDSTTTAEIVWCGYLYAATCKFKKMQEIFPPNVHNDFSIDILEIIMGFVESFDDFTFDSRCAMKLSIEYCKCIEPLVMGIVKENRFSISKQTVSELGDKGNSRTIQARKCRKRGTAKWRFSRLYKVIRSKLHLNHRFCRETIFQSYERVARLSEELKDDMVMFGMDAAAIRKYHTHEGRNSGRNKNKGHHLDDIVQKAFGLSAPSVYCHPGTYVRPIGCIIAVPTYNHNIGETIRCGDGRDQYITIAPKNIAYGSAFDMANIKEMTFCTTYDMVDHEKKILKPGAIKWKSHTLKIDENNFTYDNYRYQISLLQWLTRARLLSQLY